MSCSRTILRTLLGFIIAPIALGLVIAVFSGLASGSPSFGFVIISALLGYPIAIVVGVPMYLFLRWRGWNGCWTYIAAGALQGGILYFLLILDPRYEGLERRISIALQFAPLLMLFIPCSMMATLCFWLIVRPDRSNKPTEPVPAL